jgi:NADH-quinone oxidoreductase subunit C
MAEDKKEPNPEQAGTPPNPPSGPKDEEALSDSASLKANPSTGAPHPPVKKREGGPMPVDASSNPLVKRVAEEIPDSVVDAKQFLGQISIRVQKDRIVHVCKFLKEECEFRFNYLCDLTCVHFPDDNVTPFEIIYNLTSLEHNERVRLKVRVDSESGIESVTALWPAANWMEREVFDLFGVRFKNHPDMRRILLPADWEGHPLRKEYPLTFVENNWTRKHLPEFTDVMEEQREQRRRYGLEVLSTEEERRVREIFRGGRDPMPLDRK